MKKIAFHKSTSLRDALSKAQSENLVFKHAGLPNPWIVHPVYEGKVRKDIILKGSDEIKEFVNVPDWISKKAIRSKMNELFKKLSPKK